MNGISISELEPFGFLEILEFSVNTLGLFLRRLSINGTS